MVYWDISAYMLYPHHVLYMQCNLHAKMSLLVRTRQFFVKMSLLVQARQFFCAGSFAYPCYLLHFPVCFLRFHSWNHHCSFLERKWRATFRNNRSLSPHISYPPPFQNRPPPAATAISPAFGCAVPGVPADTTTKAPLGAL